jgi:hypothetical protein
MSKPIIPAPGSRIRLIEMKDVSPVEPGSTGTVTDYSHEDQDHGVVFVGVEWDNGRSLQLVVGLDEWEFIKNEG